MKRLIFIAFSLAALSCVAGAEVTEPNVLSKHASEDASFYLVLEIKGLANPWGFVFLPDGSVLITERSGRLLHFVEGELYAVSGLPDIPAAGQGGLLDIALHPEFGTNRLVYFSHSAVIGNGTGTAVSRGEFTGSELRNIERIFTSNKGSSTRHHYGSRLLFDGRNNLYITLGERGDGGRAQDVSDHAGSVIRIKDDGGIPADNPFSTGGGLPEIFTYGHRNQQGIALDPMDGSVWLHEHGPKGGDELNRLTPGGNYGWPEVTFGVNYNGTVISEKTQAPGIEDPLLYWVPSIAPSGITFYTGQSFSNWHNDIFIGALAGKHLRRIKRDGTGIIGQEVLLQNEVGRIRDVRTGPDGDIWFVTDESNGGLYRITPAE